MRIVRLFQISTLLIVTSLNNSSYSQSFKHISTAIGLSSNVINTVTQDSSGLIWVGTQKGLNSYNGYSIKTYFHNNSDSSSLAESDIKIIYNTKQDQLLIGTTNGLSVYQKDLDNFKNYFIEKSHKANSIKNYINDITQDRYNNIWVACDSGLFIFDIEEGKFIKHFTSSLFINFNESKFKKLSEANVSNNVIEKLKTIDGSFFDDTNDLSHKLLYLLGEIDFEKFAESILPIIKKNQFPFDVSSVSAITIDDSDRIWMGFSNGHIVQTNIKNTKYKNLYINKENDIDQEIISLYIHGNELWSSSNSNCQIYNTSSFLAKKQIDEHLQNIFDHKFCRFKDAKSGKLWIGTSKGLFLYDIEKDKSIEYVSNNYDPNSLSSNLIREVFTDKQNTVWVGTIGDGLCKMITSKNFEIITTEPTSPYDIVNKRTTSVFVNNQNNIWAGNYTNGIDVYNSTGNLLHQYKYSQNKPAGIGNGTLTGILQDKIGEIWVISYFGGLQHYNKNLDTFENFNLFGSNSGQYHSSQLLCDASNNLWVNVLGKGFYKISSDRKNIQHFSNNNSTYKNCLPGNWINLLYLNKNDQLLLVYDSQIFEFHEKEYTSTSIFDIKPILSLQVQNIFEDSNNNFYIGCTSGLYLIRTSKGKNYDFVDRPILSGYSIYGITEDQNRNLWVSTDNGLFKIAIDVNKFINGEEVEISRYLTGDGISANNFRNRAFYKTKKGKIFFGSDNGITAFFPENIIPNNYVPNIIITNFKLFNKTVLPSPNSFLSKQINETTEITLPHNLNFLSFEFAALNFINPEANQYAYKMEGLDEKWNYIGNKREANYTNLRHGNYTFQVKASNNDGIWNETGTSIAITIKPPFWKTSFAMFLYVIVFLLLLALFMFLVRLQEKNKAKLHLEQLNAEKDNELNKSKLKFFTNISHEFRTPLTLIMGPIESLIEEGKGNKEQNNLIYRNTKKLLGLIDQIMDIRKLNSGEMKLNETDCDIVGFIREIVANFEYQCLNKKITLNFESNVDKLMTLVDSDKMETIISNLISNAIKHTHKGDKILVSLKILDNKSQKALSNTKNTYTISIEDTGDGIDETEIEHVFERFYQSSFTSKGGSGIGLTLVKELTEMHNGTVNVKSQKGKGSKFVVRFPVKEKNITEKNIQELSNEIEFRLDENVKAQVKKNLPSKNQLGETENNMPLILVVEDNDEVRNYIIAELRDGYRTLSASNGKEAFELASTNFPDLIISDIMMPVMDGIELCKMLKEAEQTSFIPVILLTAYTNEETSIAGYETGAESFLAKPFSPKVLRARVKNILQNREWLKEKFSNILYAVPSNKTMKPVDEQFIKTAIKIVEKNLVEPNFDIDQFCREIGLSRTTLYSRIKALTNQSISDFIKLIRLKKSVELFREGQNSINEVAFLVGFKTHSHFSRCFSEEFSMSPSEFLTKLNKKD